MGARKPVARSPGAVLIGFQDQGGNLGLGYLAATLRAHGFAATTTDFRQGPKAILRTVRTAKPLLVGFSVIFQYYLPEFAELAAFLRHQRVACHFCAGGHFPSLCFEETLRAVPQLDSVVRGEGELTLTELMDHLAHERDWRQVSGLAYRHNGACWATPPRPLIADLDSLPFPLRPAQDAAILGRKSAPLLASRGCSRHCVFCSIRQFYRLGAGKQVRVRKPEKVAEEMRLLYQERGTTVFLFQDDDFPIWGALGGRWSEQFMAALKAQDLVGRVIWKISCRADEVEPRRFERLREAGLYMVYLGLESGNAAGLKTLGKELTIQQSLQAVVTLKELGLFVGYGFMLIDPSSTFETIRANLSFLRQITGDGSTAALFSRMLPYAGTPIQARLTAEGRLRGTIVNPDFDCLVPQIALLLGAIQRYLSSWIQGPQALANQLNSAWQEYWIMRRLFPPLEGLDRYELMVRSLNRRANNFLLGLAEGMVAAFEGGSAIPSSAAEANKVGQGFAKELLAKRNAFVLQNQPLILASIRE